MDILDSFLSLLFLVEVYGISVGQADPVDCKDVISSTDIRTSPLSCNFDADTCGYTLSGKWKRRQLYGYHLKTDIIGLEKSSFVVYDRSFNSTSSQSVLSSPELKPGTYCMSLWVDSTSIYGRLHIRTSTGQNVTGDIKGRLNSGWRKHVFRVNETRKPFKIEYQYIEQSGILSTLTKYATMAMDDIILVPTSGIGSNQTEITCAPGVGTSTHGTCDFNTDSCGYSIQGHFERRSGQYDFGSVILHGRGNTPYIVCNWKKTGASNNNTLVSTVNEPGTYCLTFWYYMTGSSVGLSVYTSTGKTLFANITDPEDTHSWTQVSVSIVETQPYRVLFQMIRSSGFFTSLQTVGLDDIRMASIQQKQKLCTQIVPEGTCTFTNRQTCGFTFDSQRWKTTIGQFDLFTRPVFPSGQDDANYAVFESFHRLNNEVENQPYDITSPQLDPGVQNITLWTIETSQKNWTEATLHINQTEGFKIKFRAYHISKHKGDFVALDDIKLTRQQVIHTTTAPQSSPTSTTSTTITTTGRPFTAIQTTTASKSTLSTTITTNSSINQRLYSTTLQRGATSTSVPSTPLLTSTKHTYTSPVSQGVTQGLTQGVTQGGTNVCQLSDNHRVLVPGGCDFNGGNCGYTFPPYLWSRHNESTGLVIFGPAENEIGLLQTYALFQSTDPSVNAWTIAEITSPTINSASDVCLTFWILMPNQNSLLEIYMVTQSTNTSQLIYDYKYTLTSQWRKIELPIYVKEPFKLVFRSQKENNYGYIGIDNIQLYAELLPSTTTVSTKTTVPTTSTSPNPTTYTTTIANYTTTTGSSTTARISSTPNTTTPMTPNITTSSSTYAQSTESMSTAPVTPNCICNCPTYESECTRTTDVPVTPIPLACAIPETSRVPQPSLSCNFDKDTCQYIVPVYPHLWEKSSYSFGNPLIGEIKGDQSVDHGGGYMLFNTYNNHVQNNQTHHIQSAVMSPNVSYCISFWYIMPTNYSSLAVYVTYTDQSPPKLVWSTRNHQNTNWTQQFLGVSENKPFYILFQSTKETFFSFLGLDNIQISADNMPRHTDQVTPLTTLVSTSTPTMNCNCSCPHIDCDVTTTPAVVIPPCGDLSLATKLSPLSCDFDERNACGYTVPIYPHLWEIHRFGYGNATIGYIHGDSSRDGDGSYLLFNTDNYHVQPGQTDEVTSSTISTTNKTCLSFLYNMPSTHATLQIYQDIDGQRVLLWQSTNTTTNGWQSATILMPSGPYKVVFSSVKSGRDSYLGVDNIELYTNLILRT